MPSVHSKSSNLQITASDLNSKPAAGHLQKVKHATIKQSQVRPETKNIKAPKTQDFLQSLQMSSANNKQLQKKIAGFKTRYNNPDYFYEVKAPLYFDPKNKNSLLYRSDEEIGLHIMLSDQHNDAALYRDPLKKPSAPVDPLFMALPYMSTPITMISDANINMPRFETNIMNTGKADSSHRLINISASGYKCWMRAAWLSVFNQMTPEVFAQRLKSLGIESSKYKQLFPLIKAVNIGQYKQVLTGISSLNPFADGSSEFKMPDENLLFKSSIAE